MYSWAAKRAGKIALLVSRAESNDLVAHLIGVLHSEMTQASQSLNGDQRARLNFELPDRVEDRDPGTQDGRVFHRIDILGDLHHSFRAEQHVLGVPTIPRHAVHSAVLTRYELASLALLADGIVPSVPWAADSFADFPPLLALWDCHYFADYFVARNNWEAVSERSILDVYFGVADTCCEDFDEDFTGRRHLEFDVLEDEGRIGLFENRSFVGLGEGGCHDGYE